MIKIRPHLNGWQRIGAILSLLWVGILCGYVTYEYTDPYFGDSNYFIKLIPDPDAHIPKGLKYLTFQQATGQKPSLMIGHLIIGIIFPVISAWLVGYLCICAVRWVSEGFKKNGT